MPDNFKPPVNSPWVLPPDKAPKMWSSVLLLVIGFAFLMGGLFYDFYSILSGHFDFPMFIAILIISFILITVGAVRFGKSYGSRRYAALMEMMKNNK